MQLKQTILAVSTGLALASLSMGSLACTTLIVGKNVSETGRVMVGRRRTSASSGILLSCPEA